MIIKTLFNIRENFLKKFLLFYVCNCLYHLYHNLILLFQHQCLKIFSRIQSLFLLDNYLLYIGFVLSSAKTSFPKDV